MRSQISIFKSGEIREVRQNFRKLNIYGWTLRKQYLIKFHISLSNFLDIETNLISKSDFEVNYQSSDQEEERDNLTTVDCWYSDESSSSRSRFIRYSSKSSHLFLPPYFRQVWTDKCCRISAHCLSLVNKLFTMTIQLSFLSLF